MASVVAQYVVSLNSNGRVVSEGSISEAIATDRKLAAEIAKEQEILKKEEEIIDNAEPTIEAKDKTKGKADGKLVMAEEILEGHVSWPACKWHLIETCEPRAHTMTQLNYTSPVWAVDIRLCFGSASCSS
jgi:hypothetical protein